MSWRPILTGAQLTGGESNTGRFGRLFVGSSPLGVILIIRICLSWGLIDFDDEFRQAVLNGVYAKRPLGLTVRSDGNFTRKARKIFS
jgi:hypothetical protein